MWVRKDRKFERGGRWERGSGMEFVLELGSFINGKAIVLDSDLWS
jgi:hypothetical protein